MQRFHRTRERPCRTGMRTFRTLWTEFEQGIVSPAPAKKHSAARASAILGTRWYVRQTFTETSGSNACSFHTSNGRRACLHKCLFLIQVTDELVDVMTTPEPATSIVTKETAKHFGPMQIHTCGASAMQFKHPPRRSVPPPAQNAVGHARCVGPRRFREGVGGRDQGASS